MPDQGSVLDTHLSGLWPDGLGPIAHPGSATSVLDRWQQVVAALGDAPALTSRDQSFSFAEADHLSDAVAARLLQVLAPTDRDPIGLLCDHDAAAIIGMLAIMKTGRLLVVLDAHMPPARLDQVRQLAGTTVCLADAKTAELAAGLGEGTVTVLRLDELLAQADRDGLDGLDDLDDLDADNRAAVRQAWGEQGYDDSVDIVFTSGSTGQPKGVLQGNGAMLNDSMAWAERAHLSPADRTALVMTYSFAAGFGMTMISLLNGAGVWSYDPRDQGIKGLVDWIVDNRLTMFMSTPHLARSLMAALAEGQILDSIRLFGTVGEAVQARDVEALRQVLRPEALFINSFGSSESGLVSAYVVPVGQPLPAGNLAAGYVTTNKTVRLYREDQTEITEPGESGEMVIVSEHLSAGYWRNPEANAQRFGVDDEGRRTYRQGDLARFGADGLMTVLGRIDAAVKVRGFLVEPSEIENALQAEDGVTDVAVVVLSAPPEPNRLVAYVAQDPAKRTQSSAALRRAVRAKLPEYMVPSAIVLMDELPHNERGKIDRQNLPPLPPRAALTPPATKWEEVMSTIWSELLGLEGVGRDEDFMALGADSLVVEELLTVVDTRMGAKVSSVDLVEAPTLREFTERVLQAKNTSLPSHPDVVTLRSEGTGTPVFCFAGGGGLAMSFLSLSRHLDARPVYAFQAHGLEHRALPDNSVEAHARRFLQLMRVIQPRGPYVLLGHSFGGLVAFEIARRLREAGEQVGLLGLLDSYVPHPEKVEHGVTFAAMRGEVESAEPPGGLRATARRYVERVLPAGVPGPGRLMELARSVVVGPVKFDGYNQYAAFFVRTGFVSSRYRLTPIDCRTTLILAENNPNGDVEWRPYLTGRFDTVRMPTDHTSLMRPPYVASLATNLIDELRDAGL